MNNNDRKDVDGTGVRTSNRSRAEGADVLDGTASNGARPTLLHRVLAGMAVALILLAWFGFLAPEPALFQANAIRVLGALVAAGIAWGTYGRDRSGLPWQRCLAAGVGGSLAVTGISFFVPALGGFTQAGWLVSGVAGGAIVVLTGYALTGLVQRN